MNRGLLLVVFVLCLSLPVGCDRGNRNPDEKVRDPILEAVTSWEHGSSRVVLRGKELYRRYCEICHSETADGNGFNAYLLDPRPADLRPLANEENRQPILKVIANGSTSVGKTPLCPPWSGRLSEDQRESIFEYLVYLTGQNTKQTPAE